MAIQKNVLALIVLSAVLTFSLGQVEQGGPHVAQGGPQQGQNGPHQDQSGPHQDQGRSRREAEAVNAWNKNVQNPQNWTTCDILINPKISCHDCNTRIICKPVGGLLKTCDNPARPHCNLGICSSVPTPDCI